ncbi:DUF4184 family protein [Micromonospora mirobrigensis]|uniref:DUF4184 family protein n=1 Tax=Micromonospora mirobrigensis TaxID=262898 RepID=A0A1C4X3K9_9ACTN|nr:DUF4184 family protein [Micromonospora mirobrigensis]SCF03029.1 protein of unknown function (DUF4184) [Micromonospora mirobrigensis]
MPLTFPSHLAPVLPLKLWRPHWFDGVALATGAVAPDVGYLFVGTPLELGMRTHTLGGVLWWCLPVALCYAWLVRRTIAGVAVHLPGQRLFDWPQYAALGGVRHPWQVTVCSALIGALSHVVLDRVTHTERWPRALGIDFHAATGMHWWSFADLIGSAVGGAVVLGLALWAAPRRRVCAGPPPSGPPAAPVRFWRAALAVSLVGGAVLPALPAATTPAPAGVRLLHLVALALAAGAWAAGTLTGGRRAPERPPLLGKEQRRIG